MEVGRCLLQQSRCGDDGDRDGCDSAFESNKVVELEVNLAALPAYAKAVSSADGSGVRSDERCCEINDER